MLPFWKVWREIKRPILNLKDLPDDVFTNLFGARYYDRFLSQKVTQTRGRKAPSERCAIYLIFPRDGLLATHESCLQYLNEKGICVTVVSNISLSADDQARVLALCHTYIERPNFGYDFGGYRDGVLSLKDILPDIKQLILLNDSCWFPLSDKTDWLDDIDALGVDFAAAASNYGLPRPDPKNYCAMKFEYRANHPNFHYCSYALSLGPRMLQNPKFLRFWQSFPLSNSKKRTVRRGEIGLTQWALANEMTHGSTLDIAKMDTHLRKQSITRLRQVADRLIIMGDSQMRSVQEEVSSTLFQMPKDVLIGYILTAVARKGASYATADFNIFDCGFPFLKKSPVWLNKDTSDKTVAILEKIDTPASLAALNEAKILRERVWPSS